jgi:hypothetical protein
MVKLDVSATHAKHTRGYLNLLQNRLKSGKLLSAATFLRIFRNLILA